MTEHSSTNRQRLGAAATVTVIGGTLFVNGAPATAASFEVANTNSAGAGSLAQAIADANLTSAADEITFADGVAGTIDFALRAPIKYDLSIVGPGDGSITLVTDNSDVLYVYNGAALTVSGLNVDAQLGDGIQVNSAGDLSISDVDVVGSLIDGVGAGAVDLTRVDTYRVDGGGDTVDIKTIDSVSITDVSGASAEGVSQPRLEFRTIGVGNAAMADVVLGDVNGSVTGVSLYLQKVAGDVDVVDVALDGSVRMRYLGDANIEGLTTVDDGFGSISANYVDRVFVDDINMSDGRGGTISSSQIGHDTLLDTPDVDRVAVSNVQQARINMSRVNGRATVENMSSTSVEGDRYFTGSLSLSNVVGDVSVTDVVLQTPSASIRVDGDTPDLMAGDPIELSSVDISDVEVGTEGSVGQLSVTDFSSVSIDGDFQVVEEAANVSISEATVWGTFSMRTSNVTMSDASFVGRGDGAAGSGKRRQFFAVDEELLGDGPVPFQLRSGSLDATQISLLNHKAESAISLSAADLTLRHSTFAGLDLSVSTLSVAEPYGSELLTASTIALDHTVLSDTGPDGAFIDESEGFYNTFQSAASDLLTVSAEHSLVPEGAAESEDLSDSNVEVADDRIGSVVMVPGRRPSAAPLADSAAVNAGDPEIAGAPATDQRGNERIRDVIEIGAVEVDSLLESIAPARFVDTRTNGATVDDEFEAEGKRAAGSTYTVDIAGRGDVPADATSVIMNITAIQPEANGFVTVYRCDEDRPTASSLNYSTGTNLGNEIVAGLAGDGTVCFFTSGSTHLTVDVVAYATAGSASQTITPTRAFETRLGESTPDGRYSGTGQMQAGSQQTIAMGGRFGIPSDAAAVVINVTAIAPQANGFATVHQCLPDLPTASSLNYSAGVNRGNEIVAPLSDAGEICVYTSATTDLVIDVVGYLPDGAINTVAPSRLFETRAGQSTIDGLGATGGPVAAGSSTTVQISGRVGIPAGAKAAIVNLTAINPQATGFATLHPCLAEAPEASSLNYESGVIGGNEVIAGLSEDGELCLFSSASSDYSIDVVGYII